MKALAIGVVLAVAGGAGAQTVTRSFGSVVFPGGTSATTPGISRNFGSVVFPGGTASPPVHAGTPVVRPVIPVTPGFGVGQTRPGQNNFHRGIGAGGNRINRQSTYVYAYPVYVGGAGYDNGYAPAEQAPPAPAAAPPQNITVIYPPTERANPVMIQPGATIYDRNPEPVADDQAQPQNGDQRYLIAFKDHTIYSAVAYWIDGETLHYFTSGNTHNQASVALIDRDLTERLNREMGLDFKLPPAK